MHGRGLGLFDDVGLDASQWGLAEYAVIAGGIYLLASIVGDTNRIRRSTGARISRTKKVWKKAGGLKRVKTLPLF